MHDKLDAIERRYVELEESLLQPDIDGKEYVRLNKERSELEDLVTLFRRYKRCLSDLENSKQMLLDGEEKDIRQLIEEEISQLSAESDQLKQELIVLMLPSDPRDNRNVLLEIRAGTGGEEAGIFCGDLLRMYSRYAESQGWVLEMLNASESAKGGYKEVVLCIKGKKVFSRLKFESGAHRVQRIPATESQGRVHTSACTVAVLAEAEELELTINPAELRIDTYRASGSGGQHVNRTDSAVRITHLPTGIVSECQDERSQHKNKDKAMSMLRSRILNKIQDEQSKEISAIRKSQVGSGDRSERIRTYNFPQGRVTDHRVNLTLYKLEEFMEGDIGDILDALGSQHTADLLKKQSTV